MVDGSRAFEMNMNMKVYYVRKKYFTLCSLFDFSTISLPCVVVFSFYLLTSRL